MKVLITCLPMIGMIDKFRHVFEEKGIEIHCPCVVQTLSEDELKELVPQFEGWIIGDDPVTREVLEAGKKGCLKAAVKWGVGADNIDFLAARELGIPITNTPNMFGKEVADIAMHYITALARETYLIDRQVRAGKWVKPCGISLSQKSVALVGFGDIGKNTAKRMLAADMKVICHDPFVQCKEAFDGVEFAQWPDRLNEADFIVFTCSLTAENRHMLNSETLSKTKRGVRIVNVARGALIDEAALVDALQSGQVHSTALDVFELEPLSIDSSLQKFNKCIFGSHNASNTLDAAHRASEASIKLLFEFLGVSKK